MFLNVLVMKKAVVIEGRKGQHGVREEGCRRTMWRWRVRED